MSRRGATLIEVLLAFTLTALMIVLILNLFPTSMATVRQAEQRQVAGTLAESQLERRARLPFSSLPVGLREQIPSPPPQDGIEYHTQLEVTQVLGEDPQFLRALKVTVRWDYRGRSLQLTRQLYLHRLSYQHE